MKKTIRPKGSILRKKASTKKAKKVAKAASRRKQNAQKRVVAVSGGFDPIHIGHVRMMQEAKALGTHLVVILNNDNWLRAKKGFVFMPEQERKEIIEAIAGVDEVVLTSHEEFDPDRSVCRELQTIRPHVFANGGDRVNDNTPEAGVCKELGIEMAFSVGKGGKIQSSSWLVDAARAVPPAPKDSKKTPARK